MNDEYLHIINDLLRDFEPISLSAIDRVKLMDRVDSKFILSFTDLLPVMKEISPYYFALTINEKKAFHYQTDYFDTPDLDMFSDHHNGKLNRYKIRQREYVESNIRFLEVKFKSNKGRVIKNRIEKQDNNRLNFNEFIRSHTPYKPDQLQITLRNRFNRYTLVDKDMQERVTVDFNLCYSEGGPDLALNELVIIELKQNKNSRESFIYGILKNKGIRPDSFSKYCLGISLLKRHDKSNNFKRTMNLINKLGHAETNMLHKSDAS